MMEGLNGQFLETIIMRDNHACKCPQQRERVKNIAFGQQDRMALLSPFGGLLPTLPHNFLEVLNAE
jgi:hypothetical protein